jgi:hypothetical protein
MTARGPEAHTLGADPGEASLRDRNQTAAADSTVKLLPEPVGCSRRPRRTVSAMTESALPSPKVRASAIWSTRSWTTQP